MSSPEVFVFVSVLLFITWEIIKFPPSHHFEWMILSKAFVECIGIRKASLFLHFTYLQSCKVTITNSQYRQNPANNIYLMETRRYFCISAFLVTANQTSSPSWWKRLPTYLRGKHGSKSEDRARSSKSRKETKQMQDRIPLFVSIPIEFLKCIFY